MSQNFYSSSSRYHSYEEEERNKNIEKCLNEFLEDEGTYYYYIKLGGVIFFMNLITVIIVFILFIYSIVFTYQKCCCKTDKIPYHWIICIIYFYGFLELLILVILLDKKKCKCEKYGLYVKIENRDALMAFGIISMVTFIIACIFSIFVYIKSRNKKENTDEPKNLNIIDNKKTTPVTETNNANQYNKPTLPVRQINVQINNNNNFQTVKGNAFMINPENVPNSELPDINEINEINKINKINDINEINKINSINNNVAPPPLPSNEPF